MDALEEALQGVLSSDQIKHAASIEIKRIRDYFTSKNNMMKVVASDYKKAKEIAEKRFESLQDYANQAHIAALAMHAPNDLVEHVRSLEARTTELDHNLNVKESELTKIKRQNTRQSKEISVKDSEISGLRSQLKELHKSKAAMEKRLVQLQSHLVHSATTSLIRTHSSFINTQQQQQADAYSNTTIQHQNEVIKELTEKLSVSEEEVREMESIVSDQATSISTLEGSVKKLTGILKESESVNTRLENDLLTLQQQIFGGNA